MAYGNRELKLLWSKAANSAEPEDETLSDNWQMIDSASKKSDAIHIDSTKSQHVGNRSLWFQSGNNVQGIQLSIAADDIAWLDISCWNAGDSQTLQHVIQFCRDRRLIIHVLTQEADSNSHHRRDSGYDLTLAAHGFLNETICCWQKSPFVNPVFTTECVRDDPFTASFGEWLEEALKERRTSVFSQQAANLQQLWQSSSDQIFAWSQWNEGQRIAATVVNSTQYIVEFIAVQPAFRRRGYASQLLQAALAIDRQAAWKLWSLKSNVAASRFYQSQNWTHIQNQQLWILNESHRFDASVANPDARPS